MAEYEITLRMTAYKKVKIKAMSKEEAKESAVNRMKNKYPALKACVVEDIEEVTT